MRLLDQFAADCGTDMGIGQYLCAKDTDETMKAYQDFDALLCSIFPGKESEHTKETELRNEVLQAQAAVSSACLQQGAGWGIRLGARLMLELLLPVITDHE